MATMGVGLSSSIENLRLRLPSFRFASLRARRPTSPDNSPAELAQLIEAEVIPRLLVAHRAPAAVAQPERVPVTIGAQEIDAFAPLLLDHDTCELLQHVEVLLERGISVDTALVDLFAPAARLLGRWWEEDRCDFVEVTMGLWRLQELVHELCAYVPVTAPASGGRRALFARLPGDQHSFGLLMVEELFRRAGWDTASFTEGTEEELNATVRTQWFELIGLTISHADHVERAAALIADLRRGSRNASVAVMVGGRVITDQPELAMALGADGTAPDARGAVERAEALLETLAFANTSRC